MFKQSIRNRLIIIVLFATLPIVLSIIFLAFSHRAQGVLSAERECLNTLKQFSAVQKRITESTRVLLQTIAAIPEVQKSDIAHVTDIFKIFLQKNPMYTNIILLDVEGVEVAIGNGAVRRVSYADRKQYIDAVATRDFSCGEYVIGKATSKPIFPFGMPVIDINGELKGVIIVGVDLGFYEKMLEDLKFPTGVFFGVSDYKGSRLVRYPAEVKAALGAPIKYEVFSNVRNAGGPGTMRTIDSTGVDRVFAYEPLWIAGSSSPYMYIFMGFDYDMVIAQENMSLYGGLTVVFVSLCVSLFLAWRFGCRGIAVNFEKLTTSAQSIGVCGDVVLTNIKYTDGEIGKLAKALDETSVLSSNRERDLVFCKEDALQVSKAKDEFIASISHEIRTPLNGVMGMIQLSLDISSNDEQKGYLETALKSSRSMLVLLDDILDFSKIESGNVKLHYNYFSIQDLINSSVDMFKVQADEKKLIFESHIDASANGNFYGDAGRIRQIVCNLIGNAIKFTESGFVRLDVYSLPTHDTHRVRLFFSVEDSGPGMPENKIKDVFKPFMQVDASLSRKHKGVGLGLPIVKRLVLLMGGSCVVDSEVGAGTTVLFCVLVDKTTAKVIPVDPVSPQVAPPSGLRVLVVEDEIVNRMTLKKMLEHMGHSVVCVVNGKECLDALSKYDFDLILMDMQMPIMDGLAATELIRASGDTKYSSLPIVGLSAHAGRQDRDRAMLAGMNEYITKPFERHELVKVIEKVISA